MAETDLAVRRDGKTLRLITKGAVAGLFSRDGLVETLVVETPASAPMRMPVLTLTEGGPAILLSKVAKPCSCLGAPWNSSAADLRGKLEASA